MNLKSQLLIGLICALCTTNSCLGQYSLDIDVQGPWILYVDNYWFTSGGTTTKALVLMAPDVMHSQIDEYNHQLPSFTAGDGTWLKPGGIYCVQFVAADSSICNPGRNATASGTTYPHNMMPVKAPRNWAWYDPRNPEIANRTYIVLPLPDDYIDDGVWWMKTGAPYNASGTNYTSRRVSIGIYLHYKSIAGRVQLLQCTPPAPGVALDGNACTTKSYSLINRGSIRIDMKTPVNNNACDFHVRYAYPRMLKMLDYRPLYSNGSSNLNANIAYVYPALTYAENGGGYDGDNGSTLQCDADDPQPKYAQLEAINHHVVRETQGKTLILSKEQLLTDLTNILTAIGKVHKSGNACDRENADPYSGCSFLDLRHDLDANPGAPTYSQVEYLNTLLKNSLSHSKSSVNKNKAQGSPVLALDKLELSMVDAFATKNGNDCRAATMFAAP